MREYLDLHVLALETTLKWHKEILEGLKLPEKKKEEEKKQQS